MVPAWTWLAVGAGSKKPLPGAVLVATPGTSADGVLPAWQRWWISDTVGVLLAAVLVAAGVAVMKWRNKQRDSGWA